MTLTYRPDPSSPAVPRVHLTACPGPPRAATDGIGRYLPHGAYNFVLLVSTTVSFIYAFAHRCVELVNQIDVALISMMFTLRVIMSGISP